jgi:hypothetical protein
MFTGKRVPSSDQDATFLAKPIRVASLPTRVGGYY